MLSLAAAVLALFVLLIPQVSRAEVVWLCGLSEDAVRLVCVADPEADADIDTPEKPRALVRGTAFPLDVKRVYSVELWGPATDMGFVEELAHSTICYRSPGCSVVWSGRAHP